MFVTPAFAQATAAGSSSGGSAMLIQFLPLLLIFGVFWFLIIRPQNKRMKDHRARIDAVKRGDHVVTGGGLVGKVTKVEDTFVEVELAPNVKVRAVKSTLTEVTDATPPKAANS